MSWQEHGRCTSVRDSDSLFFPVAREGTRAGDQARAQAVALCAACPVRRQCAEWALAADIAEGVWGGMTESERFALRDGGRRRAWRTGPVGGGGRPGNGTAPAPLTVAVARMTEAGYLAPEIASALEVHERTVVRHRRHARGEAPLTPRTRTG